MRGRAIAARRKVREVVSEGVRGREQGIGNSHPNDEGLSSRTPAESS